jgi:putative DNA methylase
VTTRGQFIGALRRELPDALKKLQHGNIAPVDLAQAAIGPGMAVFSRYDKVVEADGARMKVRSALQLINQALDEVLTEQEGEYDPDTRWAIAWFEQFGTNAAPFGVAETLSKAKDCSIDRMVEAGIVEARAGKVRLVHRDELADAWNPSTARSLTVWEVTQRLTQLAQQSESLAAELAARLTSLAEIARDLAYRLYLTCERKGWTQEALAYNGLVVAWPEISRLAANIDTQPLQPALPE